MPYNVTLTPGSGELPKEPTPEEFAALPHDDAGPTLVAAAWAMTAVASVFLVLRIACKFVSGRRPWWDDYILAASWACLVIQVSFTTRMVALGFGKQVWDVPPSGLLEMPLPILVRTTFHYMALAWSKTAFGVTLLRLTEGWMRRVVWLIIISVNIVIGVSALLVWLQCSPIQLLWNPLLKGTCWPPNVILNSNFFSGAYSAAMDFALALLPWKLLMALRIQTKEKVGAAVAMSMGVLAGILAIIKTVNVPRLYSPDPFESAQLFLWDTAEAVVTIVAASIPVLRVLIRDVRRKGGNDSRNNKNSGGAEGAGGISFSDFRQSPFYMSDLDKTDNDNASRSNDDHNGRRNRKPFLFLFSRSQEGTATTTTANTSQSQRSQKSQRQRSTNALELDSRSSRSDKSILGITEEEISSTSIAPPPLPFPPPPRTPNKKESNSGSSLAAGVILRTDRISIHYDSLGGKEKEDVRKLATVGRGGEGR